MQRTARFTTVETALGPIIVAVAAGRLVAVKVGLDARRLGRAVEELHGELGRRFRLVEGAREAGPLARMVRDYLDGKRRDLPVQVDLSWLTPFQRDVLREVARIPRGEVASYGEIARRVGRPGAYRAVGNAVGINPVPVAIPCHRVVASNGIGGFGGGLALKRRLLALEGVALR